MARPSRYKKVYAEQALKLCRLGAIDEDLADFFEVSVNTIGNWKNRHPEFLGALKSGKLLADANVANSLYHRAVGYSHDAVKIMQHEGQPVEHPYVKHYPPDTTAAIFWLKNRRPDLWRDRHDIELPDKLPVLVVRRETEAEQ